MAVVNSTVMNILICLLSLYVHVCARFLQKMKLLDDGSAVLPDIVQLLSRVALNRDKNSHFPTSNKHMILLHYFAKYIGLKLFSLFIIPYY